MTNFQHELAWMKRGGKFLEVFYSRLDAQDLADFRMLEALYPRFPLLAKWWARCVRDMRMEEVEENGRRWLALVYDAPETFTDADEKLLELDAVNLRAEIVVACEILPCWYALTESTKHAQSE